MDPTRRGFLGAVVFGGLGGCGSDAPVPRRSGSPVVSTRPSRSPVVLSPTSSSSAAPRPSPMRITTGLDRLVATDFEALRGRRVGVVTNQTGVTSAGRSIVDVLHASDKVDLRAAFGPEHGFRGTAQAGSGESTTVDRRTGLTVYNLYRLSWQQIGATFDRAGIDTVVYDIQDVGARFYTYIWTLYDVMTAAAASGRRVVVLDRPNPIGGVRVAGPVLRPQLETFVGEAPIAQQYGLTVGELATLLAGEFLRARASRSVDLQVVELLGWRRDSAGDLGGLRWVGPSPNIPTIATAQVYVGTCYFEGTNMSVGRGTPRPFETIGAPYLDGRWASALQGAGLAGVRFEAATFRPASDVHAGQTCRGVRLSVTDARTFDAIRTAVTMLCAARRLYAGFSWDSGSGDPHYIDNLSGSTAVRSGVDAGHDPDRIVASWADELAGFRTLRSRYLRHAG